MPSLAPVDLVALGLLLAFAAWGAWQGVLRPVLALGSVAVAFPLANRFGPRIESAVVKAVSVPEAQAVAIAWGLTFLGVLLAGGLLFAVFRPLLRRLGTPSVGSRVLAGGLGAVHGVLLLSLAVYALLMAFHTPWSARVAASRTARASRIVTQGLRDVLPAPAWLRDEAGRVDRRIP